MSPAAACAPVPLIGQSSMCTLRRARPRRSFSFSSSVIVLASITIVPGRAPAAMPSLPKYASSIAAGEGSDVMSDRRARGDVGARARRAAARSSRTRCTAPGAGS